MTLSNKLGTIVKSSLLLVMKETTVEPVKNVDALVMEVELVEKRMMEKFEPMLNKYNANVLKFYNLEWFDRDYPRVLALAGEQITEE